jgi:tetratricopeptide (TPR) repeat protein
MSLKIALGSTVLRKRSALMCLWGTVLIICSTAGHAQQEAPVSAAGFGSVHLPISCNLDVQAEFDQGLAMLHAFSFGGATRTFQAVAERDPDCAMAYWGLAASNIGSLYGGRSAPQASQGDKAVEKAKSIGARTAREREYISAIAVFYKNQEKTNYADRLRAYAAALKQLHQHYPEDYEAEIFYAYALSAQGSPTDQTFTYERQGAEILEKLSRELPNHPGVFHYLLHVYDHTPLAPRGIVAARRLGKIAPSSPHAVEFPAHIFARVGLWEESIEANRAGASFPDDVFFKPHAMDFLIYSYLQTGQDNAARDVLAKASSLKIIPHVLDAYAAAAMPSRYAVERHRWEEAASLMLPAVNIDWKLFPHAEAALVFSRALGEARSGKIESAERDLERLQELRSNLSNAAETEGVWMNFWVSELEINHDMVKAWILLKRGKPEQALGLLRAAAVREDSTEKDPVMPATIISARQLLGEMLLDLHRPKEALQAFQAALRNEPARYWELFGAGRAAELLGDQNRAAMYYTQLVRQTQLADTERDPIKTAEEFLAKHGIFTTMATAVEPRNQKIRVSN